MIFQSQEFVVSNLDQNLEHEAALKEKVKTAIASVTKIGSIVTNY